MVSLSCVVVVTGMLVWCLSVGLYCFLEGWCGVSLLSCSGYWKVCVVSVRCVVVVTGRLVWCLSFVL